MPGPDPSYGPLTPGQVLHDDRQSSLAMRALVQRGRRTAVVAVGFIGLVAAAVLLIAFPRQALQSAVPGQSVMQEILADDEDCSDEASNCNVSRCCKTPGHQCYAKVTGTGGWAQCRTSCTPGLDPLDPDPTPWACDKLGTRKKGNPPPLNYKPTVAPWVAKRCSNSSSDCSSTGCCSEPGLACYVKNSGWSRCKSDCSPGPDPTDNNDDPWDCKQLGGKTPGLAPNLPTADWVVRNCSVAGENCAQTRCCKDPGHQCFEKDEEFAECLSDCEPGPSLTDKNPKPWTCKALGGRTPGPTGIPHSEKLASWVHTRCSDHGEDCRKSECCKHPSNQCYKRDDDYATCLYGCVPGHKEFAKHVHCQKLGLNNSDPKCKNDDKTWSCKELGARTPRTWGKPSLYCMHVMRVYSYEADIVRSQLAMGGKFHGGIFNCDQYAIYASDAPADTYIGEGPLGTVRTKHFKPAAVGTSKDGTAANTELFMNVWEAVRWDLQYRCCDWTIKADPDAVLLPSRLRWALHRYKRPTFVVTCNKGFADGPMMFGAMEAISKTALEKYFNSEPTCRNMPWQMWGEDLWMGNCLKTLGVWPEEDHGIVADERCYGVHCGGNPYSSAFHAFKNKDAWLNCYWAAVGSKR